MKKDSIVCPWGQLEWGFQKDWRPLLCSRLSRICMMRSFPFIEKVWIFFGLFIYLFTKGKGKRKQTNKQIKIGYVYLDVTHKNVIRTQDNKIIMIDLGLMRKIGEILNCFQGTHNHGPLRFLLASTQETVRYQVSERDDFEALFSTWLYFLGGDSIEWFKKIFKGFDAVKDLFKCKAKYLRTKRGWDNLMDLLNQRHQDLDVEVSFFPSSFFPLRLFFFFFFFFF